MFKEKNKRTSGTTDTLIGAGTEMNGLLKSEAGVRIEGAYQGDIESKGDIVIGEGGVAKSNITARDVTIAGKVYGDVHTFGKLIITATGQLHGNSHAAILRVHEGGILNGSSRMERGESRTANVATGDSAPSVGHLPGSGAVLGGGHADKKAKQAG
ncbi:bactofilin family protein [Cohnella terricola]|uniref:Polymer-forming cytoskeletal protein n=1 Tax=Cohnella terricola TaxID=1289167 RepID=A0A559JMK8_9BACL|nr:polymer-forming cytoskeletal protein [Cohnella terricola]TVY01112.1 polymer-forming cytoskeletal protein [Cohnella terricola]